MKWQCSDTAGAQGPDLRAAVAAALVLSLVLAPACLARAGERRPVKVSASELSMAPRLAARELAVKKREEAVAERERDLAEAEKRVRARMKELVALQKKVEAELAELRQTRDRNFRKLVKTYSAMSPSKVAMLVGGMDDDRAVRILRAMKSEAVAKILPKLDRDKAVRLSVALGMSGGR